ncbi:glycoside hydrolase family 9 protein [Candidatus Hydrogenedentota bacterium]
MRRDTTVFLTEPASICVISGGREGNVNQKISGLGGETVVIAGHAMRESTLENVQVFTLAFDKNWKQLGWDTIAVVPPNNRWIRFENTVTFSANTKVVLFGLFVKGSGKAWMDNVSVVSAREAGTLLEESRTPGVTDTKTQRPILQHVGMISSDMVCYQVREYFNERGVLRPYMQDIEQEGDLGEVKGSSRLLNGREIGYVVGPENSRHLASRDRRIGAPFELQRALNPANYRLTATGIDIEVRRVHRKTKPVDHTEQGCCREHFIFLELAEPLDTGVEYTLDFGRINLDQPNWVFKFNSKNLRSEAVHVSHVGFRPDDPAKLGFLSMWTGTGSGYTGYKDGTSFRIVDVLTSQSVFTGKTELRTRYTEPAYGDYSKGRNFELTDTFVCDFSEFKEIGNYVLSVEGVGCSFPFAIDNETWLSAFTTSMRGFFHQRSGQEWEPPYAVWHRPRDLHPEDGKHNTVYELSISELDFDAEFGTEELCRLLEYRTEMTLPNAWGGYHDAGDYDRRQSHMVSSRRMMELYELFPGYFSKLELSIPENSNDIPDIIDEAVWCPSLYKRIQREDGGIRGGIETNGHPNYGEPSYLDTLTKMAFAPDIRASWTYVATAGQAAHILDCLGQKAASEEWLRSALKAMGWAETEYEESRFNYENRKDWWKIRDMRNLAALQLYRLTREEHWHRIFLDTCGYRAGEPLTVFMWNSHSQSEAAMLYARLPNPFADPEIRERAKRALIAHADEQIDYAEHQTYMFTADNLYAPMILSSHSAPKGLDICRAHYLTKDSRFLEWAIKSSQFSVGANPMNLVMTTGLGHRSAMYPLYLDMKYMRKCLPPPGITLFGIQDPLFVKESWVYDWILNRYNNCVPNYLEWPLSEFYFDVYSWPMANEFTVQQSMASAVFVWGYLTAREYSPE